MGGGIRRSTNKLGDRAIEAFLAQARAGTAPKKKLFDGGGLYLTLTPAGTTLGTATELGPSKSLKTET